MCETSTARGHYSGGLLGVICCSLQLFVMSVLNPPALVEGKDVAWDRDGTSRGVLGTCRRICISSEEPRRRSTGTDQVHRSMDPRRFTSLP